VSLDYLLHCDNWAQAPNLNAGRSTVRGLRNAIRAAARKLSTNSEDTCRVYLPKNGWLRPGDEVAAVRRTKSGFAVKYNPKFARHLVPT
jgi:hypothetical protein